MIAVDSSTLVAYLAGEEASDTDDLDAALRRNEVCLPPVVLSEILSDARQRALVEPVLAELPLLRPDDGYWRRVGATRGTLLEKGLKARLADAMICQSCLDYDVRLLTRDRDFRHFESHCGLQLLLS
jgi:predicted nucleic acid-binding protein